MLFRKKLLLAKIESVYATDSAPSESGNAILTKNLQIQLMQGNTVNRDVDRPTLGNDETYHTAPHTKVTFEVEVAGSGAAGTAPAYGALLRACGFSETINAGTDTVYQPVSKDFESATLYFYLDGDLHKLVGARGSVKISLGKDGLPMMSFEFTGLRKDPGTATMPVADWSAFETPVAVTDGNSAFSVHGYNAVMESLDIDISNNVVYRNVVGGESVQITDRSPSGSCTIESPDIATKDFHAIIAGHELGAMTFTHGKTPGNVVKFDMPKVQLLQPNIGDSDGIATLGLNLSVLPDAGDDDLKITVK
ncbi:phage tail tube protein [Aliamphritea hakodatensis]|uniref:phage tail tube protein n=1 Tax=Aliamphritea hakodatensis TaxID=2895352 RepID=UPI0022FD8E24|nr:phage tail tube protein [Aliamphritea hakodatensis]